MTYSIQSIDEGDIAVLVAQGIGFWDLTPYANYPYCARSVENMFTELADNHYLRVVKDGEGSILGFMAFWLAPMIWNTALMTATELLFFVHPSMRGIGIGEEMLDHAIKEIGPLVDVMSMGDMATSSDMIELYERKGFQLSERLYTRVM